MAVRERGKGNFYLYFRPFKDNQVGLKVGAATRTEAKRLEAILTRACRTGNYAALDPATGELCARMFRNQGWEIPAEIGGVIQPAPRKVLTLWEAVELFMGYPETKAKTEKALDRYDQAFINLAAILGKETALKDLWVPDLKEYQVKRLGNGAAPSTVNIELSALSRVFAVMVEMQLVETSPVRLVKRLSTKSNEREVYLSRETVKSIADKCPAWYQRMIWTAYFSGMRKGEIMTLTRRQVNLSKRLIHLEPDDTKESRRKRVPIHHELVPILEEAMRTPFLASDKVFLVQDAQGIRTPGTDTVGNPWPRACEALEEATLLKKPFPRFHDLRHTWRTNARRSGMDYQIAESIMGHWFKGKNVNDRYGRISDQELIQAIDRMTFDHGETEIFVAQKKTPSPEEKCEHFVNICEHKRGPKRKKIQILS
jgi:integrase